MIVPHYVCLGLGWAASLCCVGSGLVLRASYRLLDRLALVSELLAFFLQFLDFFFEGLFLVLSFFLPGLEGFPVASILGSSKASTVPEGVVVS